jgi:hypothetical protein
MRTRSKVGGLLVTVTLLIACGGADPEPKAEAASSNPDPAAVRMREDALASARVWAPPAIPVSQANLRDNPAGDGAFPSDAEVDCRFTLEEISGTTPKFYCELPDKSVVKIKYGAGNPELPGEVAATRLLAALGFGADRMYVVKRVKCAGCPTYPFYALRCVQEVGVKSACLPGGIDYDKVVSFDTAVIERRLQGRKIEAPPRHVGWAWYELYKVDEARGGSPLAELDALRLMAMFLAHWDNKAENQRLLCPPDAERPDGFCHRPIAILQDVGATFGPTKLDLHNWRSTPIWVNRRSCTVSMKSLPWNGATFPDWKISEEGRVLLLGLLEQLSDQQVRDLFEGSGITTLDQLSGEGRNANNWVGAFRDKVEQIRNGGPCRR